ncbi:hypothetical protein CRG98_011007 [Punica granatum]|uniref:Uncharacterized protein n=1 Tax=Punica granatum TaxID=22663 RepID=A0A2I0KK78_PUNGR|nr:hypothetical protein CRG98_011007 [Punica granatum]
MSNHFDLPILIVDIKAVCSPRALRVVKKEIGVGGGGGPLATSTREVGWPAEAPRPPITGIPVGISEIRVSEIPDWDSRICI